MNPKLFFGLALDHVYTEALAQANPQLVVQLIRNDNDHYLKQITQDDTNFIGKWVKTLSTLEELENCENHILSILKQLIPSHFLEHAQLVLLPVYNSL